MVLLRYSLVVIADLQLLSSPSDCRTSVPDSIYLVHIIYVNPDTSGGVNLLL